MKFDFVKLNELLKVYGLYMRTANGRVFFYDAETHSPMKSYLKGLDGQGVELTSDVDKLFTGWQFYVVDETSQFSLCIGLENGKYTIHKLFKDKRRGMRVCEHIESLFSSYDGITLEETKYKEDGREILSRARFRVGKDAVYVYASDYKAKIGSEKNETGSCPYIKIDGYQIPGTKGKAPVNVTEDEIVDLINDSIVLKDVAGLLVPNFADNFSIEEKGHEKG